MLWGQLVCNPFTDFYLGYLKVYGGFDSILLWPAWL
jgi:hypothetical protein